MPVTLNDQQVADLNTRFTQVQDLHKRHDDSLTALADANSALATAQANQQAASQNASQLEQQEADAEGGFVSTFQAALAGGAEEAPPPPPVEPGVEGP